jgi:hypothetical protein
MINSDNGTAGSQEDADVGMILRAGPKGAVVLAGLATTIVVAMWFAFYLLVFVPRAIGP